MDRITKYCITVLCWVFADVNPSYDIWEFSKFQEYVYTYKDTHHKSFSNANKNTYNYSYMDATATDT